MLSKGNEVGETGVEQVVHPLGIDARVAVDHHVAEAGDAAEPTDERVGEDAERAQPVNGAGIVRESASATRASARALEDRTR